MATEFTYDVFLSHNSQDKPEVEQIAYYLKDKGLKPWLDSWEIGLGDSINDKLEEGLRSSKVILIFYGKKGTGPWQHEEIKLAINWSVNKKTAVIPILLPGFTDPIENIALFLQDKLYLDLRNAEDNTDLLDRLIQKVGKELGKKPIVTKPPAVQPVGIDAPRLGPLVHKLCDRNNQSAKIELYTEEIIGNADKLPAFFVVHGEYNEKHASLVDRCRDLTLKSLLKKVKDEPSINFLTVKWPDDDELEFQMKILKREYEREFKVSGSWDVNDLFNQIEIRSQDAIVIQHTIIAEEWGKNTKKLLEWLVKDFWHIPQGQLHTNLFVFFNVMYKQEEKGGFLGGLFGGSPGDRKSIQKDFNNLQSMKLPNFFVVDELDNIKPSHVQQWVDDMNFDEYAHQFAENLFRTNGKKQLSMSEVEPRLKELVDDVKRKYRH